jgi:predicted ATPase
MAINKEEIQKYIFDPNNPKKCLSYKLLLRTAKKEHSIFFSPHFMQEFLSDEIFDDEFKEDLWDLPKNYDELNSLEKIQLYRDSLSDSDLEEFVKQKVDKIDLKKIYKYSFIDKINQIVSPQEYYNPRIEEIKKDSLKEYLIFILCMKHDILTSKHFDGKDYNKHFIILSKNYFNILQANITKSSVFITLEENIDKFFENENENIKPLFLKKIQDIDLLFNILNNDIQGSKNINKPKNIPLLKSIKISKFYSLKNIELNDLEDKKEIYIVGENGDGKTLLLQSIVLALKGVAKGKIFDLVDSQKDYQTHIELSNQTKLTKENLEKNKELHLDLLAYGANRNYSCGKKEDKLGFLTLFENDIDLYNPIRWLTYLDHKEAKDENTIIPLKNAKDLLNNLLEKKIEIKIATDGITFLEKGSEVTFEQLSAGYRGVIIIICDIIKRFSETQSCNNINEFKGVILIDEVELHLHPKWKYNFIKKLRDTFPLIQFIVTTHSPTVIIGANKEAIFYKVFKKNGEVQISKQIKNSGFTTNSIISSPLFDLDTIASRDLGLENINDDDYIYSKIHKIIAKKIKENNIFDDETINEMIEKELDKI